MQKFHSQNGQEVRQPAKGEGVLGIVTVCLAKGQRGVVESYRKTLTTSGGNSENRQEVGV